MSEAGGGSWDGIFYNRARTQARRNPDDFRRALEENFLDLRQRMSYPLCWDGCVKTTIHSNPDHNIWNNNGTFWCHFTVHNPDFTKERVRVSLHTKDRDEARQRRDFIMRGTSAIITTLPRSQSQLREKRFSYTMNDCVIA